MKINTEKLIRAGFILSVLVGLLGQYIRPIIYLQDIINVIALYFVFK